MNKNNFYQFFSTKGLLLIILLAFVIRMGFFVSLQPWDKEVVDKTILFGDATGYHNPALLLISEKSFNNWGSVRLPIYPMFLAACYIVSGKTIWFALLVQIVVNLLTLYVAYKIALYFFSKKIALLALFLLAIDYHQAMFSVKLLTETLFSFILLVSIYFLCVGLRRKQISQYMAISGCFLGLATLTRPISVLFPIVAVFFIIYYKFSTNKNVTTRLIVISSIKYSLSYVLLFLLIITPWLYRNYSLFNEPQLTSQGGANLLVCNVVMTEVDRTGNSVDETGAYFMQQAYESGCDTTEFYSFKNSRIYSQIAIKYIKNNFFLYCKGHLKGMINTFYSFSKFSKIKTKSGYEKYSMIGNLIYFAIIYLFSIVGIVLLIRKKMIIAFLFLLIIIYFDLIPGHYGGARFRVPIMPFIYIFCAIGLLHFYDKIIDKFSFVKN